MRKAGCPKGRPFDLVIHLFSAYAFIMKIVPAEHFDISDIMMIERSAFIPAIQEKQSVFEERMRTFPQGFLLLQDASDETVLKKGHAATAGYFCSEIWSCVPPSNDFFELGHSPAKVHDISGPVLYASSFALFPEYRGQHLALPFFNDCLCSLCGTFPSLKTVLLLVNQEWTGARHIYKTLGFNELRTIKNFFPSLHNNSSDGILMTAPADLFRSLK